MADLASLRANILFARKEIIHTVRTLNNDTTNWKIRLYLIGYCCINSRMAQKDSLLLHVGRHKASVDIHQACFAIDF